MAAFEWLRSQVDLYGDVLPRTLLAQGFHFQDERVPLLGPQGIFKPKVIPAIPLSVTTAPKGPYSDRFGPNGLLRYAYRGVDPMHHENVGLREAMTNHVPLIYFHGLIPGRYVAAWPVYIVGDDPTALTFTIALDDADHVSAGIASAEHSFAVSESEGRRAYITSTFRRRLHQRNFRERVLRAYREQCALCRLRHRELLDAAHIIADSEPEGEPVVSNGLALCKLHHAAYDRYFLSVRPDFRIVVRPEILEEEDGPMLQHGLKDLHGQKILLPRSPRLRPDPARLEQRHQRFLDV